MMDVNQFIGVPYKAGGRDASGWDCYGLVKHLFKQRGIALPDWYADPTDVKAVAREIARQRNGEVESGYAEEIKEPEPWAIVMVGSTRACHHIGVCVNGGVIHCSEKLQTTWHDWGRFTGLFRGRELRLYRWLR